MSTVMNAIGRPNGLDLELTHFVNGAVLQGPYPAGAEVIYFAMGCFWGAERLFWTLPGVLVTAVGYQGGQKDNPNYREVCSGATGHAESVMVVFDPQRISLDALLRAFWEEHDPTQGMRQGNDVGTQYRSAIYTTSPQQALEVAASQKSYSAALSAAGRGAITTQSSPAMPFYFAEEYHQQYLAKNVDGYCGLKGTGVSCPQAVA